MAGHKYEKGHQKFGGRKPGVPDKIKLSLTVLETLQEIGHDPIKNMAAIADDQNNPIDVRARMEAELAKYVFPQLKSVAHTGIPDTNVQVQINVGHVEALRTRVIGIAQRGTAGRVLPISIPERASGD